MASDPDNVATPLQFNSFIMSYVTLCKIPPLGSSEVLETA